MANVDRSKIKDHMPILGCDGKQIGTVDHLDPGDAIEATRDDQGRRHWIPLSWVDHVDRHVHLTRPVDQVSRPWKTSPPAEAAGQGASPSH